MEMGRWGEISHQYQKGSDIKSAFHRNSKFQLMVQCSLLILNITIN
jgi:hypothetical protein